MAEIVILCLMALVMGEIYIRTKHPKLYAFLNTAAGAGGILLVQMITKSEICVTGFNTAISGILGIPGAVLCVIMEMWR